VARTLRFREDEKILAHLEPHPLAFLDFYALFAYLVSIGAVFWIFEGQIRGIMPEITQIGLTKEIFFTVLWFICLIVPFLLVAVLKVTWRGLLLSIVVSVLGAVLKFYLKVPYGGLQISSIVVGIIGFVLTDFYRRRFDFYVTDQRILVELDFISLKRREIPYDEISDLVVEKSLLGRIFKYGSVVPITESGFGLGEDVAAVTVGLTGTPLPKDSKITKTVTGGRTVSIPRGRSFYVLFGVRNPEAVSNMISQLVRGSEETPYLKKIAAGIEALVKKEEEKEKK